MDCGRVEETNWWTVQQSGKNRFGGAGEGVRDRWEAVTTEREEARTRVVSDRIYTTTPGGLKRMELYRKWTVMLLTGSLLILWCSSLCLSREFRREEKVSDKFDPIGREGRLLMKKAQKGSNPPQQTSGGNPTSYRPKLATMKHGLRKSCDLTGGDHHRRESWRAAPGGLQQSGPVLSYHLPKEALKNDKAITAVPGLGMYSIAEKREDGGTNSEEESLHPLLRNCPEQGRTPLHSTRSAYRPWVGRPYQQPTDTGGLTLGFPALATASGHGLINPRRGQSGGLRGQRQPQQTSMRGRRQSKQTVTSGQSGGLRGQRQPQQTSMQLTNSQDQDENNSQDQLLAAKMALDALTISCIKKVENWLGYPGGPVP
eukprot:GHVQ01034081.1.p1 GENE.GHVQ01034081.1~~GHVQ01034081.1.p1  ORF type:complete len:380 (-),score=43.68 GHVQ01034081.1:360-1472(-)